jgi:hypothetical protein
LGDSIQAAKPGALASADHYPFQLLQSRCPCTWGSAEASTSKGKRAGLDEAAHPPQGDLMR